MVIYRSFSFDRKKRLNGWSWTIVFVSSCRFNWTMAVEFESREWEKYVLYLSVIYIFMAQIGALSFTRLNSLNLSYLWIEIENILRMNEQATSKNVTSRTQLNIVLWNLNFGLWAYAETLRNILLHVLIVQHVSTYYTTITICVCRKLQDIFADEWWIELAAHCALTQ